MSDAFLGYADRISVHPGESVAFKLSTEVPLFEAELVALRGVSWRADGHQVDARRVEEVPRTAHDGRVQLLRPGSFGSADDRSRLALDREGSIRVTVMPTLLDGAPTAIVSRWDQAERLGWWLGLDERRFVLRVGGPDGVAEVRSRRVDSHTWYRLGASWEASGLARLAITAVVNATNSRRSPLCEESEPTVEEVAAGTIAAAASPTYVAAHADSASGTVAGHFNGKIERPMLWGEAIDPVVLSSATDSGEAHPRPLVDWDFAAAIGPHGVPSDRCEDAAGSGIDLVLVGQPARAVTGSTWDGSETDFRRAPDQYGAIHFHDDDIEDAGWDTDVLVEVPETAAGGIYALHVVAGEEEDYFPVWVLSGARAAVPEVLLLFPTSTYLAYGNDREGSEGDVAEAIGAHTYVLTESDLRVAANAGLGSSLYEEHADGSGIGYASRLRPIPNMRPHVRHASGTVWGLPADMQIATWLDRVGVPFAVATDEDLEREGQELLDRHRVVITGTHPEYCSGKMLDAVEGFIGAGGRVMYLGANGFYWVAIPHPEKPHLLEVRRGNSGTRAWESEPGETRHAFTGEPGGIWRHRGRAPQKLFGVGFSGEGFDRSAPYSVLGDWRDPNLGWAVAGLEDRLEIGEGGLVGGAAAGQELDRYDADLGSPLATRVLATSAGRHSDNYARAVEEIGINRDGMTGTEDPQTRADVTYYETPAGGAVFATGSIAWAGSLAEEEFEGDVSRLTHNVLRRMLEDRG